MSKVWVAGRGFDCDAKIVRWDEGPRFDSSQERCVLAEHTCPGGGIYPYSEKAPNKSANRFWYRRGLGKTKTPDLKKAQAIVRMFTIHHDGCPNARSCFGVLHDERGISCHFILDNDGTIYQCLDLALMGFQAAGFNQHSIGIELCNRGDAKKYAGYYDGRKSRGQKRDSTTCMIHKHVYLAYEFTDDQIRALAELARALRYALPNLPVDYPQEQPGQQSWGMIPNPSAFSGYMGHYHQTLRKWDPGPFDFKRFCEKVRGAFCFPVFTKGSDEPDKFNPEIPSDTEELKEETKKLYMLNEGRVQGGFFPVGPFGESRLWHGGLHLKAKQGATIFAPFPGRVVAARMGSPTAIGSSNFILLRHDITVGEASVRFFTLYFHVEDEKNRQADPKAAEWLRSADWKQHRRGQVTLLDVPVEAGAVIGRVGKAGPGGGESQIHFEVFARDDLMQKLPGGSAWTVVDGSTGGRFSDNQLINDAIDTNPKDGKFTRRELTDFFRTNSDRSLLRYYGVLHLSEWIGEPDWAEALKVSADFKDADIDDFVREQITPTLWWDKQVARHCRLPRDGIVYHYHPITFVSFINEKILEAMAGAQGGIGSFDPTTASETPEGVTDDIGDVSGESFFDAAELEEETEVEKLTLEQLVEGFPE